MPVNPLALVDQAVYAPLYFSAVLCTAFYGISCMQTFYYYVHYPNDSRRMKIFVAVMWALDTIHEALIVAGVYKYILSGLVSPFSFLNETPELTVQILSEVFVSLPTQAFFVYRIYVFSGKNIMVPLLWILPAIYQIAAAVAYEVKAFYILNGSLRVVGLLAIGDHFFTTIIISSLAVSAGVDVLITIAMTYLLFRQRNAGFARTTHVLQRLVMFSVNTGLWTATFAVLSAILMHVFPSNALYVVLSVPLSSIYCNTLLANLNARMYILGEQTMYDTGTALVIRSPMSSDTVVERQLAALSSPIHLNVQKTTESATFIDTDRWTTRKKSV